MSGIYLHIPFCRKACTYCDFHFSTSTGTLPRVLEAMHRELELRATERAADPIRTIYFGGGTPSLLDSVRIEELLHRMRSLFTVDPEAEITLEANPDDVTPGRLEAWRAMGINRLSLGTQSFRDDRLTFMGRAHNAAEARRSIDRIAKAGFASWTIDLIYGLPDMDLAEWNEQLTIALDHGMPHLSAYCLTVEPRTALAHQVNTGKVQVPEDAATSAQFDRLMDRMEQAGLDHYEISNFGLPGHYSRHNISYWQGQAYLGIGPSAHSFLGRERRWNVANNMRYALGVESGSTWWEGEVLSPRQRANEMLMTGLRTQWGVTISELPVEMNKSQGDAIRRYVEKGQLLLRDGRLVLTRAGRHFADGIASDLFITDDR